MPAELAGFALPPMLVQPVVENAIRHGLEPKVEGGVVSFSARREEGRVRIEVADTGVGFADSTRGGLGLSNLRDRAMAVDAPFASRIIENAHSLPFEFAQERKVRRARRREYSVEARPCGYERAHELGEREGDTFARHVGRAERSWLRTVPVMTGHFRVR